MSNLPGIPNSAFQWEARNKLANDIIEHYAKKHQAVDISIGLAGGVAGLLIPGASFAGLVAALVAAAPVIYNPMTQKLAYIYKASPDHVTRNYKIDAILSESLYDAGADLLFDFTTDFIMEFLTEMWPQLAGGALASLVPGIGLAANAVLDGIIASTLTWRLGTMTVIYYMNDENWLYSSKKRTRQEANRLTGFPSANTSRPNALSGVIKVPEVFEKIVGQTLQTAKLMKEANPNITNDQLREIFKRQSLPDECIEEALRRLPRAA